MENNVGKKLIKKDDILNSIKHNLNKVLISAFKTIFMEKLPSGEDSSNSRRVTPA